MSPDVLFEEPYVARMSPCLLGKSDLGESSPTDSFSASTQMGFNYTVGLFAPTRLDRLRLRQKKPQ